jgi:hypothetical protein
MNIIIITILLVYIIQLTSSVGIDHSLLIETYIYETDLSKRGVSSVDINTNKGYDAFLKVFLEENIQNDAQLTSKFLNI